MGGKGSGRKPGTYHPDEQELFRGTPIPHLVDQRDRLYKLASNERLTPYTRRLAHIEAEYMADLVAFRSLDRNERRRLAAAGITPWARTYKRPAEK